MTATDSRTWLCQWREREGLSQDAMAALVGVSRSRWSEIERGDGFNPLLEVALNIERVTGIPPRDFLRVEPLGRKFKRKEAP